MQKLVFPVARMRTLDILRCRVHESRLLLPPNTRGCDPSRRHREKAFSLADKCFDLNQRALEVTRNRGLAGDFQVVS